MNRAIFINGMLTKKPCIYHRVPSSRRILDDDSGIKVSSIGKHVLILFSKVGKIKSVALMASYGYFWKKCDFGRKSTAAAATHRAMCM